MIKLENNQQRVYFMVDDGEPADLLLEKGPIIDPDNYLQFVYQMADGALGSRGAALIEKYSDYDGKGVLFFVKKKPTKISQSFDKGYSNSEPKQSVIM